MTENTSPQNKTQTEYLTGALFGLITLDLFMFLIHCITERSISGYGLGLLAITLPIALVWYAQHLYSEQVQEHAH